MVKLTKSCGLEANLDWGKNKEKALNFVYKAKC